MNPQWFCDYQRMCGVIPDTYLVLDLETTGLDRGVDVIVQTGSCQVSGRCVVDWSEAVLDWTRHPRVGFDWVDRRLTNLRERLAEKGRTSLWTAANLVQEGEDPLDALSAFLDRLTVAQENGIPLVGHNIARFDLPFLTEAGRRFLGYSFEVDDRLILDTGSLEKAHQLEILPAAGETPGAFARRAASAWSGGLRWGLESYAIPKYGLDVKHGLDLGLAHMAVYDAYLSHLLLEHYREVSEHGRESHPAEPAVSA